MDNKTDFERMQELKNYNLYTLTEVEKTVGISHRTLLEYVKTGKLEAVKIAGKWRVTEEALKAFTQAK